MNDVDLLALHSKLVSIKSVSRSEDAIADYVYELLSNGPGNVYRHGNSIIAIRGSGPKLLFNSHLDTVPATDGWDTDPWVPTRRDGAVYGLGSNDAKASVAAIIGAFLTAEELPCEVALMLVPEEETGGKGTEIAWPWLRDELGWHPEGVVVGEPTNLQIGVAQKGLMILELTCHGDACHAANCASMRAKNPVWSLAEDLVRLRGCDVARDHHLLGPTTFEATCLSGSAASNQVPSSASATIDVRTTPSWTHKTLLEEMRSSVRGDLNAKSTRLEPYECPSDARIVECARRVSPVQELLGSRTMSDQVYFTGVPAIKCGPGKTERSHTANEYVMESEILDGARFYKALISEFGRVTS